MVIQPLVFAVPKTDKIEVSERAAKQTTIQMTVTFARIGNTEPKFSLEMGKISKRGDYINDCHPKTHLDL